MIDAPDARVSQVELCPSFNVSFPLRGTQLPADHGYVLYSAISKSSPLLHGINWLAIELISTVIEVVERNLDSFGVKARVKLPREQAV